MPRVSIAFFVFAALCGLTGMGWGIFMGMTENHQTFTAHAHLNLLGWVSCSLMGGFYALAKEHAPPRLAWANLWLSTLGPVAMIPALAGKLNGLDAPWIVPGMSIGSTAAFLGMACFTASVITVAVRLLKREAARA
jgi:hypothetical protein